MRNKMPLCYSRDVISLPGTSRPRALLDMETSLYPGSTPFCNIFWRAVKEYDKFTTVSNSVDTREVCLLFG